MSTEETDDSTDHEKTRLNDYFEESFTQPGQLEDDPVMKDDEGRQ